MIGVGERKRKTWVFQTGGYRESLSFGIAEGWV
jgi:hypothetical protein